MWINLHQRERKRQQYDKNLEWMMYVGMDTTHGAHFHT